jgi:hypothetical protein
MINGRCLATPVKLAARDLGVGPAATNFGGRMSVTDYTDNELINRAVKGARPRICGPAERWVCVKDTFGLGSTYAIELCRLYGLDPHETVDGPRCLACDP